ncbi:hypothetical protein LTR85_004024 [Meristemomyces frigidus]|nr:hypothetical protein LTR85_004024 [Meristemomyces frigidus]
MATLVCQRATCLRSLASTARAFSAPAPVKASFSTAAGPLKQLRLNVQTSRPAIVCRIPPQRFAATTVGIRHASSAPSASPTPNPPNPSSPPEDVLTWNRFFDLRRKRRYINLVASLATAFASVVLIGPVVAQQDLDTWGAQVSGLDPFIVLGISGVAIAAGGWLCGPSIGSGLFSLWAGRRGWNKAIAQKEKKFFAHVVKHRADPSSSSPQNPIPDYYGEKIGSVKDYRRWLKDQRAFNLKKNKNLI